MSELENEATVDDTGHKKAGLTRLFLCPVDKSLYFPSVSKIVKHFRPSILTVFFYR